MGISAALLGVLIALPVLWAKLIVLAGLVLPVTLLCAVVDFFAASAIESSRGVPGFPGSRLIILLQ